MSDEGKDQSLHVAPADGVAVPADLNGSVAEVQYDRVLDQPKERPLSSFRRSQRVDDQAVDS